MPKSFFIFYLSRIIHSVFLIICLASCSLLPATAAPAVPTPFPATQVVVLLDYLSAKSITEVANQSTIIAIGTAVRIGDIINLWRQNDDSSKPSPDHFGTGQVYELEVGQYLKGSQETGGSKTIYLVQAEGNIADPSQIPPTNEEIQRERALEHVIPVKLGVVYLFFLRPIMGMTDLKLHYTGTMQPWRFFLANGCAYPESPWPEVGTYFQPQLVDELIAQVENPQPEKTQAIAPPAYPAQSMSTPSKCQNGIVKPYPFPYP